MEFAVELEVLRKKAKTREQKYAVEKAGESVSFRLRMESPFKKELKAYFLRQSNRIKRGLKLQTMEQELDRQYERVATNYRSKVKNDVDDLLEEEIALLLAGMAENRSVGIDATTRSKLDDALRMARSQLAEDGIYSPTDRQLRIIAGNIFKSSNAGRVGTIALMETAFIDDEINRQARSLSDNLFIEASQTGDVAMAREAQRISPSLTGEELVRDISIGASSTAIKKKIDRRMKMWITMQDAKVRSFPYNHQSALFQKVPYKEPFVVSNELLMEPRDSSMGASAGNTINCRCYFTVL